MIELFQDRFPVEYPMPCAVCRACHKLLTELDECPGPEHRVKTTMTTRTITLGLQLNTGEGITACIDSTGIKGSHKKISPNYVGAKVHLNDLAKAFSVRDLEDMLAYRRTQLGTK